MTTLIAVVAIVIYLVFYFTFGKTLRDKLLKSDKAPKAPSERLSDGVDYIPDEQVRPVRPPLRVDRRSRPDHRSRHGRGLGLAPRPPVDLVRQRLPRRHP